MGMIRVVKYFLIVLTILYLGELTAEENEMSGYGLFLSPESCFLLGKAKECDILVNIKWRVAKSGSYCLYNNLSAVAIDCWSNQKHARKEMMLSMENEVVFELRHQTTSEVIYQTPLKIYKKISKLRRKRRNPWSFY